MNPIIVVEGRDDTRRLKEVFPEIETELKRMVQLLMMKHLH